MKILIIEDNANDFYIEERSLRSKIDEVDIYHALSMEPAEKLLKKLKFDAVISDLRLPDKIKPIEVIRRIKRLTDAPIMVVSGSEITSVLNDTIHAGADRFIQKGTMGITKRIPSELLEMVEQDKHFKKIERLVQCG